MEPIRRREILSYGFGDFACNGIFTMVSSFIMFFYTDAAGLELEKIALIILTGRTMEAIFCPIIGGCMDRTRTRWGRVRPYLMGSIVPLCVLLYLLFRSPDLSRQGKTIYAFITFSLFSLLYAVLSVAYSTMMTCMTDDNGERMKFNMAKILSANLGAFFVTSFTMASVHALGRGNTESGFRRTMLWYGLVCILVMLNCVFYSRERVGSRNKKTSIVQSLKSAIRNRHWICLCIITYLTLIVMNMRNQSTLYYAAYCLGNEALGSVLLSVSTFVSIPIVVAATGLERRIGKRGCMLYGLVIWCIGTAGIAASGKQTVLLILFQVIASAGIGAATSMFFVMMAEVVDYSEYQTGERPQGFITATISFTMKIGVATAGFVSAKVLEIGKYQAGKMQTASALRAIRMNFIWIPFAVCVISILVTWFYRLDFEYPTVKKELERRKNER